MANNKNFLSQFRDKNTKEFRNFTALQFADVWSHYDNDGNGFIEGSELDNFLREFMSSLNSGKQKHEVISDSVFEDLRKDFMATYDENNDNRIEITELAQILPTDETFLLLFRRDNPLESSIEFIKIWKQFDKDNSGYIDADELKEFLKSILHVQQKKISEERITEYTTTMLQLFDQNKDGKLQLSEMARLLPVKENYLSKPIFKNVNKITSEEIERVFEMYDRDKNGTIENDELQGFLKDLLDSAQEEYDDEDMKFFQQVILTQWDVDHDGKINKDELKMILLQQSKLVEKETDSS